MLLLVRHAHAGDKRHWQGAESLRPPALDRLLGIEALPALGVEADPAVVLALLGGLQYRTRWCAPTPVSGATVPGQPCCR